MPLGPDSLVLCAGTCPRAGFRERVEAAARAGFHAVSLYLTDYERAREEGLSDVEMRRILADAGIAIAELDPLLGWLPGSDAGRLTAEGRAFLRFGEEDFHRAAHALGARSLQAVSVAEAPPPRDAVVEAFAGLCERAARHDLLVHLEFLPWTHIPDLASALDLARATGLPNAGVTLDTWHFARSGGTAEELREAPAERILSVQLSDTAAEPWPDPVEETLRGRLLPGEGDARLAAIVRALDAIGSQAPLGVEVFSERMADLPAPSAACQARDALRGVLAEARGRR